jgi:hypothetical protein
MNFARRGIDAQQFEHGSGSTRHKDFLLLCSREVADGRRADRRRRLQSQIVKVHRVLGVFRSPSKVQTEKRLLPSSTADAG